MKFTTNCFKLILQPFLHAHYPYQTLIFSITTNKNGMVMGFMTPMLVALHYFLTGTRLLKVTINFFFSSHYSKNEIQTLSLMGLMWSTPVLSSLCPFSLQTIGFLLFWRKMPICCLPHSLQKDFILLGIHSFGWFISSLQTLGKALPIWSSIPTP